MSLLEELRAAMPDKRITIAIGADSPQPQFNNHFNMTNRRIVQERIWAAVDAIHLMTYGMQGVTRPVVWVTHSDVNASKATMDRWAEFGKGQAGFCREKLIMGCAFYGIATPTQDGFYRNGGGVGCDTPETLKQKVDFCWDNEYGGVMIWELGYDKNLGTTPDLLTAIWDATMAKINQTAVNLPTITEIQIYPNPATTELHINFVSQETADYIIYNTAGQIVLQGNLQSDGIINVQSLSNGVYFLRIANEMLKVMIAK
jgi:GH18 family chitinase